MKRGSYKHTARGYASYKRLYRERKLNMQRRGLVMADEMYSKAEYEYYAAAEREGRKREVSEGIRVHVGDVNRALVKEQTYELSFKQGQVLQKAVKEATGKKIRQANIRAGEFPEELSDAIKDRYRQLREAGVGSKQAKRQIGQEYFDSPD